jgi:hypothetical protein
VRFFWRGAVADETVKGVLGDKTGDGHAMFDKFDDGWRRSSRKERRQCRFE